MQKLLTFFFSTKNIGIFEILRFVNVWLTNDVVSFEQPGPRCDLMRPGVGYMYLQTRLQCAT